MTPATLLKFAIGPVGAAFIAFLTLPVLTWFASAEDIGKIALLQVALSLSFVTCSLGLDQAFVREYYDASDKGSLFKAAFIPGFILVLVLSFLAFLFRKELGDRVTPEWVLYLVLLCAVLNFANTFMSHWLRMLGKGWSYSFSLILQKAAFLCFIGIYLAFSSDLQFEQLATAQLCSLLALCAMLGIATRYQLLGVARSRFSYAQFKTLAAFGMPLILGSWLYWALTVFDRLALGWWADLTELGVYSVGVSFAAVAIVFQSVFTSVWSPIVYKWAADGEDLKKLDKVFEVVTFVIVVIFVVVGTFSWLVNILLPDHYVKVEYIIASCMGFPLLYTLSEVSVLGVYLSKKTGVSIVAPLSALLVNVLLAYLLVPTLGASGAAISTLIAFFVFLVVRTELAAVLWRPLPRLRIYICVGACTAVAIIQSVYGPTMGRVLVLTWLIPLIMSLFLLKDAVSTAAGFTVAEVRKLLFRNIVKVSK